MTGIFCMIRMDRMNNNEMTWMAAMTGIICMIRMDRMNNNEMT